MAKKWFEILNKSEELAEIWIYEQIGEDWWSGDGVTAKSFQKELAKIKASKINLHINSPGGEVFDGITIYNLIKQHSATVTTFIDGLAASIASVIALAGDKVVMAENAMYMVHNPFGFAMGSADEMRKMADTLDKVRDSIATTYISKTGMDESEIYSIMDAESWLTADEALELGFIDEIAEKMDMAACAKFVPVMQKAKFKNIPSVLMEDKKIPTIRDLEKALRDAGCTKQKAKEILKEGYKDELIEEPLRDVAVLPVVDEVRDAPIDAATTNPIEIQDSAIIDTNVVVEQEDSVAILLRRAEALAPTKNYKTLQEILKS